MNVPGTYILVMRLDAPLRLVVGRLGSVDLPGSLYAYVGSAHGPGGLRARIGRHRRRDKHIHWHIDALTAHAPVVAVWWRISPERLECEWARTVGSLPGATVPMPGFGSSDCRCPAHLFALSPDAEHLAWEALGQPDRSSSNL